MHEVCSAEEAMAKLKAGNEAFVREAARAPQSIAAVADLAKYGQKPYATIITCADSRVDPALLFSCAMGDIFVVRTAGQVLDTAVLGSIEYGADHLGTKLVVVLGHSKCGAVAGACEAHGHTHGALASLLEAIAPCVEEARKRTSSEEEVASIAEDLNIEKTVERLKQNDVLRKIADLRIVGAKYDVVTGKVEFR